VQFSPRDAMEVFSDARLRAFNMYDSRKLDHCRDATRHALLLLRKMTQPLFREGILARCGWLSNGLPNGKSNSHGIVAS
jgi:hypothetical protein